MQTALIAMSGGVDSSLAAKLMVDAGYRCIGCTMKLYGNDDLGISKGHTCCSLDDVEDARSVAHVIGIPYYVFNFSDDFHRQVMDRFVTSYEQGLTPNPCIDCNRYMKFERLFRRADELGADVVVTGHYARIEQQDGLFLLKKALDPSKDQSYVLYTMTQEQLARTLFPLGALRKSQVRDLAAQAGFINADKPDSQDICFVPDGDYPAFLQRYTGKTYPPGPFLDTAGNVMGTHRGTVHYTVGQRKGLGIACGTPRYVTAIDPIRNTVTLGARQDLLADNLTASDFNWISGHAPEGPVACAAKIRYRQTEQPAIAQPLDDGRVRITFEQPQEAIAPGQAVVLYDGDTVLGGGRIDR